MKKVIKLSFLFTLTMIIVSFLHVFASTIPLVTFETDGGSIPQNAVSIVPSMVEETPSINLAYTDLSLSKQGDLNQDNHLDYVLWFSTNQRLYWVNPVEDELTQNHLISDTITTIYDLIIIDYDQDDDLDIFCVVPSEILIYSNDGLGHFTEETPITLASIQNDSLVFAISNLTSGLMDLYVFTNHQTITFFEATSNGYLPGSLYYEFTDIISTVAVSDVTQDLKADIIAYDASTSEIIFVDGDTLLKTVLKESVTGVDLIGFSDMNQDSYFDFYYVQNQILTYALYDSSSYLYQSITQDTAIKFVALFDMDQDDDLDFVIANQNQINFYSFFQATYTLFSTFTESNISSIDMTYAEQDSLLFSSDSLIEIVIEADQYKLERMPISEKMGYHLLGYSLSSESTDLITYPYIFNSDTTFYAIWEARVYTINYVLNDGINSINNPTEYTALSVPLFLEEPTKEGYLFGGWYLNSDFTGNQVFAISALEESLSNYTLYAKWVEKTYQLTFMDASGFVYASYDYFDSDDLSAVDYPALSEVKGYTFVSWSESIPATMPNHNLVIYSVYSKNQYEISFETNGGSLIDSITLFYGDEIPALSNPEKLGYEFSGWTIDATLKDMVGETVMPDHNLTFYAKWALKSHSITYYLDGGLLVDSNPTNYTIDSLPVLNSPQKIGFRFLGWYLDEQFSQDATLSFTVYQGIDLTYYAKWEAITYYIVFYDELNQEIARYPYHFQDDLSGVIYPEDPIKQGYFFAQWSENLPTNMPNKNINLYPVFEGDFVNIEYQINHQEFETDQVIRGNQINTFPLVKIEGYSFLGWYYDSEFTSPVQTTDFIDSDTTLYGKIEVLSYLLTIIVMDTSTQIMVPFGSYLPVQTPSIAHYEFIGWMVKGDMIQINTFTMPASALNIYAQFIDHLPPIVNGVKDQGVYQEGNEITATFVEGSATLNGYDYVSGTKIIGTGSYTLIVTDDEGNQTIVHFQVVSDQVSYLPLFIFLGVVVIVFQVIYFNRKKIIFWINQTKNKN